MIEQFKPQSFLGSMLDLVMTPLMYVVQGNLFESPQRTHFWNNLKLRKFSDMVAISRYCTMLNFPGDPSASDRWLGLVPLFHLPIFGGWKKYVVLEPAIAQATWFVGWNSRDVFGISRVPLTGPVRLLIGKDAVAFFAFNTAGEPVELRQIGEGVLGQPGPFSKIPLR